MLLSHPLSVSFLMEPVEETDTPEEDDSFLVAVVLSAKQISLLSKRCCEICQIAGAIGCLTEGITALKWTTSLKEEVDNLQQFLTKAVGKI